MGNSTSEIGPPSAAAILHCGCALPPRRLGPVQPEVHTMIAESECHRAASHGHYSLSAISVGRARYRSALLIALTTALSDAVTMDPDTPTPHSTCSLMAHSTYAAAAALSPAAIACSE